MYVGTQGIGTSKMELEFLVRHGVTHMDAVVDGTDVETLTRHREEAAAEGVELETIHIDLPRSITLAQDPQRDRDLDTVCGLIENAGRAGLRGLNYNFCILGHQRTERRPGTRRVVVQLVRAGQIRQRHTVRSGRRQQGRGLRTSGLLGWRE